MRRAHLLEGRKGCNPAGGLRANGFGQHLTLVAPFLITKDRPGGQKVKRRRALFGMLLYHLCLCPSTPGYPQTHKFPLIRLPGPDTHTPGPFPCSLLRPHRICAIISTYPVPNLPWTDLLISKEPMPPYTVSYYPHLLLDYRRFKEFASRHSLEPKSPLMHP